jgi:hypothetical protein
MNGFLETTSIFNAPRSQLRRPTGLKTLGIHNLHGTRR